jgi:hypothetical protein
LTDKKPEQRPGPSSVTIVQNGGQVKMRPLSPGHVWRPFAAGAAGAASFLVASASAVHHVGGTVAIPPRRPRAVWNWREGMSQRTWMWIIGVVVVILAIYFFMGSNEPEAPAEAPAPTATEPAAPATTEPAAPATEPAAPATTEPAAPATEPAAPATEPAEPAN